MNKKDFEEQIFEVVSYMTVSARNLLEEPAKYGPVRLVDAVTRLVNILDDHDLGSERLDVLRGKITDGMVSSLLESEEVFENFLEDLVMYIADEIDKDDD